jgi:hypothetical protein
MNICAAGPHAATKSTAIAMSKANLQSLTKRECLAMVGSPSGFLHPMRSPFPEDGNLRVLPLLVLPDARTPEVIGA